MVQIIPAILATSDSDYSKDLHKVQDSKLFEWVQIDLMDNKFVQNQSINPEIIAKYPTKLNLEGHLMVEFPDSWIDDLTKLKFKRIIFPVEDLSGIDDRIKVVKNLGIEVGLAINPETDIDKLKPFLAQIDLVLIMGVHPGFQGQEFITESINKVESLSKIRSEDDLSFLIEVDGGLTVDNIKSVIAKGADILVIGSHLIEGDIEENLETFWEAVNG